jgi:fatty acid desaturase
MTTFEKDLSRQQNFRDGRAGLEANRAVLVNLARPIPFRLGIQVLLEWSWIIGAIMFSQYVNIAWLNVFVILFIGTRQHALLILMHEFTHRQFSRKRKVLNDIVGDIFTALPFLITIFGYRRDHFQHHRTTSTNDDPNWTSSLKRARYRFPRSRVGMIWLLVQHCLGVYALQDVRAALFDAKMTVDTPRSTQLRQLIFYVLVMILAWIFNLWMAIALYWFLPMFTSLMAVLYLRDVAEHHAMPAPGLAASRTMHTNWLEGFLIAPNSVNYHAEHHLYPSVPFCRLRELHTLLKQMPFYADHAVITRGYLSGLLHETALGTSSKRSG